MAHLSHNPLNVPHYPQADDGYCLPACVQMVLAYLGLSSTPGNLARKLDVRLPLGAPASNVTRLRSDTLDVTFTFGDLDDLRAYLNQGHPPIVFVQAGEFPHWRGRVSQHAVVVVGADEHSIRSRPCCGRCPNSCPHRRLYAGLERVGLHLCGSRAVQVSLIRSCNKGGQAVARLEHLYLYATIVSYVIFALPRDEYVLDCLSCTLPL